MLIIKANAIDKTYLQNSLGKTMNEERLQNVRNIFRGPARLLLLNLKPKNMLGLGLRRSQNLPIQMTEAKEILIKLGEFLAYRSK